VVDVIPATERDEQFAHAVAVLQHFFLQLSAIAHQMARGFILDGGHTHHDHAVTLAMKPCPQVGDESNDV